MIKTESITIDGKAFIRTYSDSDRYVVRDGESYTEAVDPAYLNRTYTEGELIPAEPATDTDYMHIGKIMMGVTDNDDT